MHVSDRQYIRSRASGFSLVELMVTVAIVSILLSIAVPSYSLYMKKSRRGNTESVLMDIAQREQAYLLDQRAYAPDLTTLGNYSVSTDVSAYYNIAIATGATPPTFTITATPISGTAQAGDYTLTVDNTGARTPTNVW